MPPLNLENLIIDDRYEVCERLAQGSYAEIYEALDLEQGRRVIIKALNTRLRGAPDAELEKKLIANFEQEASLMESLRHANIAQSFGQGEARDRAGADFLYLALEHLAGGDLNDYCRKWPLSMAETIRYFQPVCEALSVIHSRGVIHRDIKPGNLLFDANRDRLKITDFGVARVLGRGDTREITRVGTDIYSAPEHHPNLDGAQEPLTPAADVYSLAKTIYAAMIGRPPNEFRRRPIDRLPPELEMEPWGARLLAVLRRATADRVGERYPSANDFWRDFTAINESGANHEADESDAPPERDETTISRINKGRSANVSQNPDDSPRDSVRRIEIDLSRQRDQLAQEAAARHEPGQGSLPPIKLWLVIVALLGAVGLTLVLQSVLAELMPEPLGSLIAVLAGVGLSASAAIWLARRKSPPIVAERPAHPSLSYFTFDVVTVDSKGKIRQTRKGSARRLVEPIGGQIALEMVEIPGGEFQMGSPKVEAGHKEHEEPQRNVKVAPFFLGSYPITQSQWRIVAQWPKVDLDLNPEPSSFTGDNLPVEGLSWREAVEFCQRLSRRTGRRYRLPSEAEWEYACRAGSQTPFHCGDTIAPGLANYDHSLPYGEGPSGAARKQTSPVGAFGVANDFGLFDMHGNVWEWLDDAWHHDYNGAPADGDAWRHNGDENLRVVRGGAWFNAARICRSAYRYFEPVDMRGDNCGFRVAMTMDE